MQHVLDHCRKTLGEAPRRFSFKQRFFDLRVPEPAWCRSDELHLWFQRNGELLREGSVRWGHIVQANVCLYAKGEDESGGEVLFCLDNEDCGIAELGRIAHQLYSLKGRQMIQPELSSISSYLAEETVRVFGLPIPPSVGKETLCAVSSTPLPRKYMPEGVLSCSYFPILMSRKTPHIVMMVPFSFWPETFVQQWERASPQF